MKTFLHLFSAIYICAFIPLSSEPIVGKPDSELIKILEDRKAEALHGDPVTIFVVDNLDLLGSNNPRIRDDLFFSILENQIRRRQFSPEALTQLLSRLTSSVFLFKRIDNPQSDEACRRSFAVLSVAQIINMNNLERFLSTERLREMTAAVMRYAREEKNVVGWDSERGWIHASAHTADALAALARCHDLSCAERLNLLAGVEVLLLKSDSAYIHRETWRMALVVLALASDETIPDTSLKRWTADLGKNVPLDSMKGQNVVRFLQDLYFGLKYRTDRTELLQHVERLLVTKMRL